MSELLERMITAYYLRTSSGRSATNRLRRNQRFRTAEAQNWRCCYCGVRMFAGVPSEDIFQYAQSIGLSLKYRGGGYNAGSFEHLRTLRATIEHVIKQEHGGIWENKNITSSCWWCNNNRGDIPPTIWYKRVQELVRNRKHPHYKFINNDSFRLKKLSKAA